MLKKLNVDLQISNDDVTKFPKRGSITSISEKFYKCSKCNKNMETNLKYLRIKCDFQKIRSSWAKKRRKIY